MSEEKGRHEITLKPVVYRPPDSETVEVRSELENGATGDGALTLDLYTPSETEPGQPLPTLILTCGYPDPGFESLLGCRFKEMASSVSWGRLAAASGIAAITYTNREPVADLAALLDFLAENGGDVGIDPGRIGLLATSGNVPLALSTLMQKRAAVRCAALCYGFTLDSAETSGVAESAARFGFVNPAAGRSVRDLPPATPLFVARAGKDEIEHLNPSLDRFVAEAIALNLPITFVNHSDAPHAFDLVDATDTTRELIRQILAFLRFHLRGGRTA